jgi:hypothetical protein
LAASFGVIANVKMKIIAILLCLWLPLSLLDVFSTDRQPASLGLDLWTIGWGLWDVGFAVANLATIAAAGAATGAATGAGVGAVVGAGVGAIPGAIAGATTGAVVAIKAKIAKMSAESAAIVGQRLAETSVSTGITLAKDQITAVTYLASTVASAVIFVGPTLIKGVYWVAKTFCSMVMEGVRKVQVRYERYKERCRQVERAESLIAEGPLAVMDLYHWIIKQQTMLAEYPVEAVVLIEAALNHGQHVLLDFLIQNTAHIIKRSIATHQLYASLLVSHELPVRYLEAAVGESPEATVGANWWIAEFLPKIVVFPKLAFHAYLRLFFKAFPYSENNSIIQRLEIPRTNPKMPAYIRYQMDFLKEMSLYYFLKGSRRANLHEMAFYEPKTERTTAALEFYLELSGFMSRLAMDPEDVDLRAIARWIIHYIVKQDYGQLVKQDHYRILKVVLVQDPVLKSDHVRLKELLKEATEACAVKTFVTIAKSLGLRTLKAPGDEACAGIRHIHNVLVTSSKMQFKQRCADIVSEINMKTMKKGDIHPEGLAMPAIIAAAGTILEQSYSIDRDEQYLPEVAENLPNVSVDGLVNEAVRLHCCDRKLWPTSSISLEGDNTATKSVELGPSKADIMDLDVVLTPEQQQIRAAKTNLARLIHTGEGRPGSLEQFQTQLDSVMNLLSLKDAQGLLLYTLRCDRPRIFEILIEKIAKEYEFTELEEILEDIRGQIRGDTQLNRYKSILKKYNYRFFGVIPKKKRP